MTESIKNAITFSNKTPFLSPLPAHPHPNPPPQIKNTDANTNTTEFVFFSYDQSSNVPK